MLVWPVSSHWQKEYEKVQLRLIYLCRPLSKPQTLSGYTVLDIG